MKKIKIVIALIVFAIFILSVTLFVNNKYKGTGENFENAVENSTSSEDSGANEDRTDVYIFE